MTQTIDTYAATVTTLPEVAASNKDVTSKVSESVKPTGNHGEGVLIAHFNVESFLKDGETELATGTYDLGEVFPAKAYVSGDAVLDVTQTDAGAGDLHLLLEGGTAVAADTAGKTALTGDFDVGDEVGGKKLQAFIDTGVITAGAFTVTIPYRISGYSA